MESERDRIAKFKALEASRPDFDTTREFVVTKTPKPDWQPGDGATSNEWKDKQTIGIDPKVDGSPIDNYKLLISAIVPRPVGFLSTVSADGKTQNLAPYSFFQVVCSSPPLFVVGLARNRHGGEKDSLKHLLDTKEVTINMISEWFIDSANYASITSPDDVSEWDLTGLHPVQSVKVKAPRVAESAFSVEAKLLSTYDIKHPDSGAVISTVATVEGVYFHVREDVINPERNNIDFAKLKPIGRMGGISYCRITDTFDIPRYEYFQQFEDVPIIKDLVEK
ncbi:hypothetical protein V1511DRAFT_499239 [Dipodascopsis uninucleata]